MTSPSATTSIFSSVVETRHAGATFAVDADTMAFMLERAARTTLGLDGRARIVLSPWGAAAAATAEEIARVGHHVSMIGGLEVDPPPSGVAPVRRIALPPDSPLAPEMFVVIESGSLALLLAGRAAPLAQEAEADEDVPMSRFEGVWSFDPGVVARAMEIIAEQYEAPEEDVPSDDESPTAAPRLDLLAVLFSSIIRRMEDQKAEIVRVLEEFDTLAAEADLEEWRDPESWLPGRELFIERLDDAVRRTNLGGPPFCVLLVSVRGFDATTQSEALRGFGSAISNLTRSKDFVGHIGGGRVAIAAIGAEATGGETFARRLLASLRDQAAQFGGQPERPMAITVAPVVADHMRGGASLLGAVEELHHETMCGEDEVRVVR